MRQALFDYTAENINVKTPEEAIAYLVDLIMKSKAVVNKAKLIEDILKRESVSSTAIDNKLALPHAKSDAVTDIITAIITLKKPIEFDTKKHTTANVVVLVVAPKTMAKEFLKKLSAMLALFKS